MSNPPELAIQPGTLSLTHLRNLPSNTVVEELATSIAAAMVRLYQLACEDLANSAITSNAQFVEVWDGHEWTCWYSADGRDFEETYRALEEHAEPAELYASEEALISIARAYGISLETAP